MIQEAKNNSTSEFQGTNGMIITEGTINGDGRHIRSSATAGIAGVDVVPPPLLGGVGRKKFSSTFFRSLAGSEN